MSNNFIHKLTSTICETMASCAESEQFVKDKLPQKNSQTSEKFLAQITKKSVPKDKRIGIYDDGEASIYASVIMGFLRENPELASK